MGHDQVAGRRRPVAPVAQVSSWLVIGAGSAGCVVAARLSEDPHRSVTLLEAGPDLGAEDLDGPLGGADFLAALEVPGRTFSDLVASRTSGARPSPYPRGCGLGGSSVVNAMVALRGDADLYRAWGWADADAAWSALQLPSEEVADAELGPVDRALLAAAPDAERAHLTRRDGRRVTSAEASLWPALARPNLVIRTNSPVERLMFDGRRIEGARLVDGTTVAADRVVLCAGAIHSPTILLRSDVDTAGIGEGLQDHPSAPLTLALHPDAVAEPGSLVIGSLLRRDPLQFLPMNHLGPAVPGFGLLMVALMRPRSHKGTVRLADDPSAPPIVDFALLDDPRDVAELAVGVRAALRLLETPAFADITEAVYIDESGTTAQRLGVDGAIEQWLRHAVGDYVHASSTCAMGRVLDADAALVGYEGVYVCDASVFPTIPDANTHLPTTMLAERLAARWRRADRRS